jgi:hypothetical protein
MNAALWLAQGLLALVFLWSAYCKGTWSRERLVASGQTGVQGLPLPLIRFVATAELFGVVGLVVPWATGIAPVLTPIAALGLGTIMVLAAFIHARLHEPRNVLGNIVLLAVCLFVAFGRGTNLLA